jgi:menaquinone-9 beta-reductase
VSECVKRYCSVRGCTRERLEQEYRDAWQQQFAARLWRGRQVQRLFGQRWASAFAVNLMTYSRPIARQIIRSTHGPEF